jgi:hypothetical protein
VSQNTVQIFDDNVLKITIKQGSESERFNIDFNNIHPGGDVKYGTSETINILAKDSISTVPGSFSSGELAYTRDTGRVFVGSLTDSRESNQQITFGGTLVGNKYLGFVDSKRVIDKNYGDNKSNGTPLNLAEPTGDDAGLLTAGSQYRSYNFANSASTGPQSTSDGKWPRLSFYNSKYDAYDGDYMYDVYRNALILFDHNIKPSKNPGETNYKDTEPTKNTTTLQGKRKTPLIARELENGESTTALETVKKHTEDMYGDGYVLFYNVIPDGETLTFTDRSFKEDGSCNSSNDTLTNNFSYNVIRLNKVPVSALSTVFDDTQFNVPTEVGGKITLKADIAAGSGASSVTNPVENGMLIYKNGKITGTNIIVSSSSLNLDKVSYLSDWNHTETVKKYLDNFATNTTLINAVVEKVTDYLEEEGLVGPGTSPPSTDNSSLITNYNLMAVEMSNAKTDVTNLVTLIRKLHPTSTAIINEYFAGGVATVSKLDSPSTVSTDADESTIEKALATANECLYGTPETETWEDENGVEHTGTVTVGGIAEDIQNLIFLIRRLHPNNSLVEEYYPTDLYGEVEEG